MSFAISLFAAFILGVAKAGLKGMGVVIVTLMALVHGAKASTGIIIPLLIFADILAVTYYKRHARWEYLWRFLPWVVLGVFVATFIAKDLPEELFKNGMAAIILISVVLMFGWEKTNHKRHGAGLWLAGSMGFAAGFSTMIGNLAGAFTNIYFLSTRIPKNDFIGTAAWLYFIVNLIKLPLHIFSWGTINYESLMIDLYLFPMVLIGFWLGLKIVDRFQEQQYRNFILIMTAVGALVMLLK